MLTAELIAPITYSARGDRRRAARGIRKATKRAHRVQPVNKGGMRSLLRAEYRSRHPRKQDRALRRDVIDKQKARNHRRQKQRRAARRAQA